ncbi:hypothetical protein TB1_041948 [Malus domestica]
MPSMGATPQYLTVSVDSSAKIFLPSIGLVTWPMSSMGALNISLFVPSLFPCLPYSGLVTWAMASMGAAPNISLFLLLPQLKYANVVTVMFRIST